MKIDLSNPVVIYIIVWTICLVLFAMGLTSNLSKINVSTMILIISNLISIIFIYIFIGRNDNYKNRFDPRLSLEKNQRTYNAFATFVLSIWLVGTAVDIVYSGGLPLQWAMTNIAKDYTDFGVPSFHGVINAFYLFGISMIALRWLTKGQKRDVLLILLLMTWPVLMLGRGILLSAIVQIAGLYFFTHQISARRLVRILSITLVLVLVFGFLGDLRGQANPYIYLIDDESAFHLLPSGFLWFYVYVTAGINNIVASIDIIHPNMSFYYSVINLIPSFIRRTMPNYELNASLIGLVDKNLNTSTFYSGYVSDFGLIGGIIGGIVLQLLSIVAFYLARRGNLAAVITYCIFYGCIFFTPFYDLLFLLPYLAQLALGITLGIFIAYAGKRKRKMT